MANPHICGGIHPDLGCEKPDHVPHTCTECGEQFAHILAYEHHDCPKATICGYCFGPLEPGTHNSNGCSDVATYITKTHHDGWCDAGVTIHDGTRVFPVGCIQELDHDGPHTWTTLRPESTWTTETRISLPMDSDAN
ncbi:hypothetical protein LCGC14_2079890 [marine sediment metagenome]|uniref:Uncharacterized protein n=1 Tax=marine sediment metagenome TaxID=412755 RepID=A0A0F9EFS7_9ZZZZ